MAIDFPTSPATGQIFNATPGLSFVYRSGTWTKAPLNTALPKNYILNSAMEVSQQNGVTAGTTTQYFIADQWMFMVTGIVASGQSQVSVDGYRGLISVTTGKALAATDFLGFMQDIEGLRFMDAQFGSALATDLVARFTFYTTVAGTYGFTLRNDGLSRSFVATFTHPGAGWVVFTIPIPGDTTGSWVQTTAPACAFAVNLAVGSTYVAAAPGWNAGNWLGPPGMSNGALTSGNAFYLKDVGLYLDPYKTKLAPPFESPPYPAELIRCQRYWQKAFGTKGGITAATTMARNGAMFPVTMRATPTLTVVGAPLAYDGAVTPAITAMAASVANSYAFECNTTTTTLTTTRSAGQISNGETNYFACSARM